MIFMLEPWPRLRLNEEAVETVKEAVKPLGEDYCKVFNKALDTDRWVDKYENKGKRSYLSKKISLEI